jgi:hypothetical protein
MLYDGWDLEASNDTTYCAHRWVKDMLRHGIDFGNYAVPWYNRNMYIDYYNALAVVYSYT